MMSDTDSSAPLYTEPGPGTYSTEEHLKAQQEQASASNGEPLHPELSGDSELDDPAEVGEKGIAPIDTASSETGDTDAAGKHGGTK